MGLDMYLSRKSFIMPNEEYVKPEYRSTVSLTRNGVTKVLDKISYIVEEVMYWRKANAIHNWFVNKVQKGNDDCGEYEVTTEQLTELRDLCAIILADKDSEVAHKLLPTQSGFFFGSTDYDDWYYQDLTSTMTILDKVLAESTPHDTYYYSASW